MLLLSPEIFPHVLRFISCTGTVDLDLIVISCTGSVDLDLTVISCTGSVDLDLTVISCTGSVDLDLTAHLCNLISIYTVCLKNYKIAKCRS
jgi:hypothetical protein